MSAFMARHRAPATSALPVCAVGEEADIATSGPASPSSPQGADVSLSAVRELARKRPEQEFLLARLYGAHVSPYFTLLCLRLGLGPDQVTLLRLALGALGAALLVAPLGAWSLVGIVALQVAYVLDFSDGQVARLTGRTSAAGSYLDWLSHFYIPLGVALALAVSLGWWQGSPVYPVIGIFAALELAAFGFSCKEHILVAMLRRAPGLGGEAAFHAALRDDARPSDVTAALGPAIAEARTGLPGRAHGRSVRSLVGEILLHQESIHLVSLAVVIDLLVPLTAPLSARGLVLALWAALFFVHVPLVARRNHALIRALEANSSTLKMPAPPLPPGGSG
jgi:hypothetical protein